MTKLLELKDKRAKAWQVCRDFLDTKRGGNGLMSAEDVAAYEKMETEITDLTAEIEREERLASVAAMISAPDRAPVTNTPGAPITGRASEAYAKSFWNAMRRGGVRNDLAEGTGEIGGYLVPTEFERTLVQALQDHNIMRGLARIISTNSGEMQIPVVADGGTASWVSEAGEIPESDANFAQVILGAWKIGTMIKVSQELLSDSAFPLESFLAEDFGRRIGTLEESAFIAGDGNNKPTGVFTSATVGATAASATALTFDDVINLYHSLRTPYRHHASFITNDLTIKALRTLKSSDGAYIWQPSVKEGTPDTILGRPVHVSGYVPVMAASAKVMAFGDYTYYWIGDRLGRTFQRLNELYSERDQVGFKATQRVDGKLILPEAVQVLQMASK